MVVNEVPLKQVSSSAAIASGSGTREFSGTTITSDLSTNASKLADVIVPNNEGAQTHVFYYAKNHYTYTACA